MTRFLRTPARRRTLIVAAVVAALAPAGVAVADPDTNIQKPGHLSLEGPDTNIQKPGHLTVALEISRPLGDA